MPLRSRHENGNWSLNRKIEVATKLRVEQKGGRNLKRSQMKADECLKHSDYTRVGLTFLRLFYIYLRSFCG